MPRLAPVTRAIGDWGRTLTGQAPCNAFFEAPPSLRTRVGRLLDGTIPELTAFVSGKLAHRRRLAGFPGDFLMTPAIKVGWQTVSRFWEEENNIYGGISWTTDIIGQIWYPSEDFNARTAVITGA